MALGILNRQASRSSSALSGMGMKYVKYIAKLFLWFANHLPCNVNNFGEFVFSLSTRVAAPCCYVQ